MYGLTEPEAVSVRRVLCTGLVAVSLAQRLTVGSGVLSTPLLAVETSLFGCLSQPGCEGFSLMLFYLFTCVWLLSLQGPLFSEGKWRRV